MIDWDRWREDYDSLTWRDQLNFHAMVERLHPDQRFFTADSVREFLGTAGTPSTLRVLEIGGWKGELAAEVGPTQRWVNVEIFPNAILYGPEEGRWYKAIVPEDFIWDVGLPQGFDVLIMSHTIEHIRYRELAKIIAQFDGNWVYLEAPLHDDGRDWSGYSGAHVMEVGWEQVHEMMRIHGFRSIHHGVGAEWTEGQIFWYAR